MYKWEEDCVEKSQTLALCMQLRPWLSQQSDCNKDGDIKSKIDKDHQRETCVKRKLLAQMLSGIADMIHRSYEF